MLELGVGADLLRAAGWFYVCVAFVALMLALWLPPTLWSKSLSAIAVIGVFGAIPVSTYLEAKAKSDAFRARYEVAAAKFAKLCETAGDTIHRTVDNVEGIRIIKWVNPERLTTNPAWEAAAFVRASASEDYATPFLLYEEVPHPPEQARRGSLVHLPTPNRGYSYVEVAAKEANEINKRVLAMRGRTHVDLTEDGTGKTNRFVLKMEAIRGTLWPNLETGVAPSAGYGVSVEDLPEARDLSNWIAGGRIRVIDLKTGEVMAEHRRFAFDPGMGSTAGGRQQWLFADSCPSPNGAPFKVRFFVDQVLKPTKEASK